GVWVFISIDNFWTRAPSLNELVLCGIGPATWVAAAALGIARAMLSELITLAFHKAPRGFRLADNAVMQADLARAKARLGLALAYLIDTLTMRRPATWR
ncbi:hypothetical protein, partial [Bradyrhizobium jicamae]|uniref:hypothetical protein n=1 Tax=Bradyrhizobium jicamae TaxID=280332 RepID=UPI000AA28AD8